MSRRGTITMTEAEQAALIEASRVAQVATIGPNGRPHLVPLWFTPRGIGLATWTYATSQKAANLRRLPQATVLFEAGDSYEQLRGVSMECDVELVEDPERVAAIGQEVMLRYTGGEQDDEVAVAASQFVRVQAAKRVGLVCTPTKVVSWDHAKLGGTY